MRRLNMRGFTLPEVMVTVAILGAIATLTPDLFNKFFDFFYLSEARTTIQRDTRKALDLMNRNLRQAYIGSLIVDQATGQPPYSRVQFIKVGESTLRSYYQSGNKLMEGTGSDSRMICENVRFLSFTFPKSDDLSIMSVSMTLEKIAARGTKKAIHVAIEKVRVMNE